MRPTQTNSTLVENLQRKRKIEEEIDLKQSIVQQAQILDQQGQSCKFFYNQTIQKPTAITKSIKAKFTFKPEHVIKPVGDQGTTLPSQCETNLITFSSNVLKVFTLGECSIDLKLRSMFNDKIIDVIKVPTKPFVEADSDGKISREKLGHTNNPSARGARANRRIRDIEKLIDTTDKAEDEEEMKEESKPDEIFEAPDYLFIVTQNFNCALLRFSNSTQNIEVVSRGNISEKIIHDRKEPPFPIFLGQTGTFIALMLYHNLIKIIPLIKSPHPGVICSLTHAISLRLRHSNVLQVVPLISDFNQNLRNGNPSFGVLYQKTEHVRLPHTAGPPVQQVRVELERYIFDKEHNELVSTCPPQNGIGGSRTSSGKIDFQANSVYRIESLAFGGFLAFDLDSVSYCNMDLGQHGVFKQQLKSPNTVTAICQVDEYDRNSSQRFIRYLFATESGELFMLAFHMEALNCILRCTDDRNFSIDEKIVEKLMTIELLASKLTFCSSLVYLDNSFVFYSSKEGDSFILKICSEHQGNKDQPYITIEQRFQSLAPIMDLQLTDPQNTHCEQSELVVVTGWNYQTHMSLVKQGVGLKSIFSFEDIIPRNLVQSFHIVKDKIYLRVYGYEQLIGLHVKHQITSPPSLVSGNENTNPATLAIEGSDVPRNSIFLKSQSDKVLLLDIVELVDSQELAEHNGFQGKGDTEMKDIVSGQSLEKGQNHECVDEFDNKLIKAEGTGEDIAVVEGDTEMKEEGAGDVNANKEESKELGERNFEKMKSKVMVFASNRELKVLTEDTFEVLSIITAPEGQQFTLAQVQGMTIVVSQQNGVLKKYIIDPKDKQIQQRGELMMKAEISSICLSQCSNYQLNLAYVALLDAPFYSLNCIDVNSMRIVTRVNLHAFMEVQQTIEWFKFETMIKNGKAFSGLNVEESESSPIPEMLQDLPKAEQIEEAKNQSKTMQTQMRNKLSELQNQHNCSAARSIEHLLVDEGMTDHVICGFANGKLVQINFDMQEIESLIDSNLSNQDCLDLLEITANQIAKEVKENHNSLQYPFWGANVCYVGTLLPKLKKIMTDKGQAIIACCDKPIVFYEVNQTVEMHYLAFNHIREVGSITFEDQRPMIMYEDEQGLLHLSENDSLRKLQIQRMMFKMQITKTLLLPNSNSVVVLLEQPNLDYIDSSKQLNNAVGLVSRSTLRASALFQLQRSEIANCACHIKATMTTGREFILVGTTYLKPEEQIPSLGRLILLDALTLEFVQEYVVMGSVQSLLTVKEQKYLLVGVNNSIEAYDMTIVLPQFKNQNQTVAGKLDLLDSKQSGSFIQSIIQLPQSQDSELPVTIVVGDMAGHGIATFELREGRLNKLKIQDSARTSIAMWVNCIVPLSESQFIVFDQEGNMFIFKKNLYPVSVEEKLKLTIEASYFVGEEVHSATFGSLKVMQTSSKDPIMLQDQEIKNLKDSKEQKKIQQKKKSYSKENKGKKSAVQSLHADEEMIEESKQDDTSQKMIVTRGSVVKQQNSLDQLQKEVEDVSKYHKILSDLTFAKLFAQKALEEIYVTTENKTSIIYGTSDGSIGQLFSIPPKAYILLQLLQNEMETVINVDLQLQKRSDYRKVKQAIQSSWELTKNQAFKNGIIDGDYIEVFQQCSKQKQLEITKGITSASVPSGKHQHATGDIEFTDMIKQIIMLLQKQK